MSTPAPAQKVVIAAGQRFSVPSDTDNETVRQQLIGMGFADVANAEVKKGKDPDGTETIEFVKKAGTKGLTGADLLGRLHHIPAQTIAASRLEPARIVARLLGEQFTFEEAVADDLALNALREITAIPTETRGAPLCQRLDALPAVASADPRAW